VAAAPEDKTVKFGLIFSIRNEDIPKDNLLCSTPELRTPYPLRDSRSKQVKELVGFLKIAYPEAVIDRGLFGPQAMALFSPEERKAIDEMLAHRTQVEAKARDLTPENFVHWIDASIKPTMVRRFIERGIDVNRPTALGERPLVHAARYLEPRPLELLLAAGAEPNLPNVAPDREKDTALIAVSGHSGRDEYTVSAGVRIVKALLAKKASATARNEFAVTALHRAASQHPELARLLLDAGAPVNAVDHNGSTPLHRAAQGRQLALARELLDRGADVNAEEMGGVTPLLLARDNDDKEMAALLSSRGGSINHAYYLKREAARGLYMLMPNRH
jgi:ankyrin repeat protein